jgi:hypothetical protein
MVATPDEWAAHVEYAALSTLASRWTWSPVITRACRPTPPATRLSSMPCTGSPTRTTFARSPERTDYGSSRPSCDNTGIRKCLLLALNSLPELPLVGLLSGANQTPLWQPPETGLTPKRA